SNHDADRTGVHSASAATPVTTSATTTVVTGSRMTARAVVRAAEAAGERGAGPAPTRPRVWAQYRGVPRTRPGAGADLPRVRGCTPNSGANTRSVDYARTYIRNKRTRGAADLRGSGGIGASVTADRSAASRAAWEADARAAAARLKACYALYRGCVHEEASGARDDVRPGYAVVDPFELCCTHLIAVFPLSSGRAATMVSLSVDLTERYPAVLAALAAGRLDQRAAELLARQMRTVDPAVLSRVQQEAVDAYLAAIEAGERPGEGAVRGMVDEIIARHDADGIRQRREDASRDRGVTVSRGADGMSTVWATLASDEAAVLAEKLDQRAEEFADLAHYSLAERRADALMSLVLGQRGDGSSDSPLRPRVTVIAGPGTADGEPVVQFPRTGDSSIRALLALLGS